MRKLTVKNFSVIKDAEMEFGKITVLIGPQSSGKSLLCKLTHFLSKEVLELAVENIVRGKHYNEFRDVINGLFFKRFPTNLTSNSSYDIELTEGLYTIRCFATYEVYDGQRGCTFSEEFVDLYAALLAKQNGREIIGGPPATSSDFAIWTELNLLLTDPVIVRTVYIPAGRAFFTNASLGFNALQNPDIDPLIRKFPTEISWDASWRGFDSTHGDASLREVSEKMDDIAGGYVQGSERAPVFVAHDGRKIPFTLLSSGTQELLPLFNVLGRIASTVRYPAATLLSKIGAGNGRWDVWSKNLVYLEEPEANIFPETQYELVRLFAWLSHEPTLDFSWVITTHSPYILSAFNNLIEAGQAARNNPTLHDEVARIIPERYWIKEGDFKAYAIEDGKLRSILNESGFIEGNYLDQVSEVIGNEFDELLRLEYDHTKAS